MISSIIWLFLVLTDRIDSDNAPWVIYLFIATVEVIAYLVSLPKICDWVDKVLDRKVEGQ